MIAYKVVIVNEPLPFESYVSGSERIDFLAVGQQFHGRHFNGKRPLLFIDQTTEAVYEKYGEDYVRKWTQHVRSSFSNVTPVKVVGNGVFVDSVRESLTYNAYGAFYLANKLKERL